MADEVVVGYRRRDSGLAGITWPESVDVALCFGWIDGIRRSLDETSYSIRFTPRRPRSIWSAVNVRRFGELEAEGLVTDPGRAAFAARRETAPAVLHARAGGGARSSTRRSRPASWPPPMPGSGSSCSRPTYRRQAAHWVMSAKKPETRERRLATLIADSEAGLRVGPLRRP